MKSSFVMRGLILAGALAAIGQAGRSRAEEAPIPPQFQHGTKAIELLPDLPSSLPLQDYEERLYKFLRQRTYADPKYRWAYDRKVRDTGPFILRANYGTHGAVRIYYSPGILAWLARGRKGAIPDGAMIIKEQFSPPPVDGKPVLVPAAFYNEFKQQLAAQYPDRPKAVDQLFEVVLHKYLSSWAVMVKDKRVSHGGWFWANPGLNGALDDPAKLSSFPNSGAGQGTCLRCHASAASQLTFSSLKNIVGFEKLGEALPFRVDNDWRRGLPPAPVFSAHPTPPELPLPPGLHLPELPKLVNLELSDYELPAGGQSESDLISNYFQHLPSSYDPPPPAPTLKPRKRPSKDWTDFFPQLKPNRRALPGQWADHVPAAPGGAEQFVTSDNCLGCHGGLGGAPYGVTMFVQTGAEYGSGYNVSEFGEWRWSPMGLAGRDPIFFAQLESEFALLKRDASQGTAPGIDAENVSRVMQSVANTCLSCHAAMGQRQLALDVKRGVPGIHDANFYLGYIHLTDPVTTAQKQKQEAERIEGKTNAYTYRKYGNLAREGISCTICHHINPPRQWTGDMTSNEMLAAFFMNSTTGVFPYSPPLELNGPFKTVKVEPMKNSLGITPKQAPLVMAHPSSPESGSRIPYLQDSKMCGTCHVINLPNVDAPTTRPLQGLTAAQQRILNQAAKNGATGGTNPDAVPLSKLLTGFQHSIEQATYLEWENSGFAWDGKLFQSCQDCHMPKGFHGLDGKIRIEQLKTQIATIQDSNYPAAEHSLNSGQIDIPVREAYRRHELVGLNAFLLEMFNPFDTTKPGTQQFDGTLRVAKLDPETFADNGNRLAIENMQNSARNDTVDLDVAITNVENNMLTVRVTVTNKVGHRFPSGVGFRRAFLEVALLRDGQARPLWASGVTNSAGVIVDGDGRPLPTERLPNKNTYQRHHQVITRQDQVQIYEELVLDAKGRFTTSFIHRDEHPKDNRLLPLGYLDPQTDAFKDRFKGDGTSNEAFEQIQAFMAATTPEGEARKDPDFEPGSDAIEYKIPLPAGQPTDSLEVRATMYYQAIPPFWLLERFRTAPEGPATQRLYYLTSLLNTTDREDPHDEASQPKRNPVKDWKLKLTSARQTLP